MLEQLVASLVDGGDICVGFQVARAGDLTREVVARVEVFKEAANGVEIFVYEIDSALLWAWSSASSSSSLSISTPLHHPTPEENKHLPKHYH
jgi:hypothetical protein